MARLLEQEPEDREPSTHVASPNYSGTRVTGEAAAGKPFVPSSRHPVTLPGMSELRTTEQRKSDVIAALEHNGDAWLSSASPSGRPHLIAVSTCWTGSEIVIATRGPSRTARNLDATRSARLAIGSPDDAILVDVDVVESLAAGPASGETGKVFVAGAGWNPADEGPDWRYFRLRPVRIQAYRGYGESEGRDVMRDGNWLA